jgi:hypothetical protein
MTHDSSAPDSALSPVFHAEPAEVYASLCSVRDELRLFASIAARPPAHNPEAPICRSTLAYCLDHLAQRVENVVSLLDEQASS